MLMGPGRGSRKDWLAVSMTVSYLGQGWKIERDWNHSPEKSMIVLAKRQSCPRA